MTGTRLSRFVNNYSPMHDKPWGHLELNSGVYLDDELSEKLADDRRRNVQHHLVADKAFKEYCAARLNNASTMRV
ncbi:hypothetical protein ABB37_08729 [Leptomonas pyrrhocoris]|uniref:Uncharacterized protein n=1 Tax=Leptomonas pyrrhocoris TaxID=157538 RepID=A0A0N0DRR5_LEPPY|nr:hypothetical protein ABB37_08729 [Leptomonas pyrrhocoris]XP_015653481.1 hypothetical protein ABB37_08729 [Leptomonas pyrrhocoris]KPA75041.1 hypothetical protein ABB37_08729 [Leptomonas pyrrhocoris]KPA75042.1 hypothetical protein ABB37_08729 [Leptomonas pyrrhocoris]|eukprot:XP_015653480.1 hypothetical protein ABB37_08729 [Leptomonas pyrrhocoris]